MNTKDDDAHIQENIHRTMMAHDHVLRMHGFCLEPATREIRFDIIIDFAAPDRTGSYRQILSELEGKYPRYSFAVSLDVDASE